jgi:PAS domain S-box-containing protein
MDREQSSLAVANQPGAETNASGSPVIDPIALAAIGAVLLQNIHNSESLRESEARFRLIADASPVMTWVTDAAGRITIVNRAYCDFFGVTAADIRSAAGWQPLIHPDDKDSYLDGFMRSLEAGTPFFAEARVRRADGQWRWIASYIAPRLLPDGRIEGAIGTSPDVTDAKEAKLALEVSRRRLKTIVDTTPALVYIVDADNRFTLINHEMGRLFDIDASTVSGKSIYEFFPRDMADQYAEHNRQVIAGGTALEFEEVAARPDGLHYYVSVKAPLLDDRQRPVGICGVSTDITQQRRLRSALEAADREKDAFVATISHELRQPLGAIHSALAVMRMQPDGETAERARQIVERQVRHITRLVDDLLDAARIAKGKVVLRRERITLNSVIESTLAVVMPVIKQTDQQLEVSMPADPLWLDGDPTRLQQIFSNLLGNASKFTPPRGRIRLQCDVSAGAAVVRVSDSGRGIPRDVLPRIFEVFTQGGIDGRGLGIGLAVVRGLVVEHGGAVEAHSDGIGMGSTFTVRLPLAG